MTPKVTFIVPFHNIEAYLRACLVSISRQSFRRFEVLMVDDCSDDRSASVAEEFARADSRFRLLRHSTPLGPACARNTALDQACGEWIACVDGDDNIHPDYLAGLLALVHISNSDIAVCTHTLNHYHVGLTGARVLTPQRAAALSMYQRSRLNHSLCGRLIRRSLFGDDLRLTPGILYEDMDLCYRLFMRANSIAYAPNMMLYRYVQRPGSILHSFDRARLSVLDVSRRIEEQFADDAIVGPAARDLRLSCNFSMLRLLHRHDMDSEPEAAECWAQIKRLRRECLFNPHVRMKNRVGALVSYLGRKAYCLATAPFTPRFR